MSHIYTSQRALTSDAHAISLLFALSWQSPFSRLQFGDVDPDALANAMTSRIARQIEENSMLFMVARDVRNGHVVSVAQWTVPASPATTPEHIQHARERAQTLQEEEDREEREAFEDEVYFNSLPSTSNRALIMEFTRGLRNLRQRILQGQPHFLLENLATHPEHRGCGLAAKLISDVLDMADERGVVTYLETADDNRARGLYERLGFQERGRETIRNLSKFASTEDMERVGVEIEHTHVGFVRDPKQRKD